MTFIIILQYSSFFAIKLLAENSRANYADGNGCSIPVIVQGGLRGGAGQSVQFNFPFFNL